MEKRSDRDVWLAGLKVGDDFVLSGQYGCLGDHHEISRETDTRFYYRVNERCEDWFNKKDGYGPRPEGCGGVRRHADPLTPEFLDKKHRKNLLYKIYTQIEEQKYKQFSIERLNTLLEALTP